MVLTIFSFIITCILILLSIPLLIWNFVTVKSTRKLIGGNDNTGSNTVMMTTLSNHITELHKCAHLSPDFFGYVPSNIILEIFPDDKVDRKSTIKAIWNQPFDKRPEAINKLFDLLQSKKWYEKYLNLIERTMNIEKVTHLELKHEFGRAKIPIDEEISLVTEFAVNLRSRMKSLTITLSQTSNYIPTDSLVITKVNMKKINGNDVYEYIHGSDNNVGLEEELNNKLFIVCSSANRIRDENINDAYLHLWKLGVNYFAIQRSLICSIEVSSAEVEIKKLMFSRWHDQYCNYFYYEDKIGRAKYAYALDKDCKWYVRSNFTGHEFLQSLCNKMRQFMERSLELIDVENDKKNINTDINTDINTTADTKKNSLYAKIIDGMSIYSDKPNLAKNVTWSIEEYNMPEFQYTYIRLKSLQRYTECYNMYETVFGGVDENTLHRYKSIVAVGGGCGFELLALIDYFSTRGISGQKFVIIDVASGWANYSHLIPGCEFVIADVNNGGEEVHSILSSSDLIIFSYVFKYLEDKFFTQLGQEYHDKPFIFNERGQNIGAKVRGYAIGKKIFVRGIRGTQNNNVRTFIF